MPCRTRRRVKPCGPWLRRAKAGKLFASARHAVPSRSIRFVLRNLEPWDGAVLVSGELPTDTLTAGKGYGPSLPPKYQDVTPITPRTCLGCHGPGGNQTSVTFRSPRAGPPCKLAANPGLRPRINAIEDWSTAKPHKQIRQGLQPCRTCRQTYRILELREEIIVR